MELIAVLSLYAMAAFVLYQVVSRSLLTRRANGPPHERRTEPEPPKPAIPQPRRRPF